jgi:hypothetical protein
VDIIEILGENSYWIGYALMGLGVIFIALFLRIINDEKRLQKLRDQNMDPTVLLTIIASFLLLGVRLIYISL